MKFVLLFQNMKLVLLFLLGRVIAPVGALNQDFVDECIEVSEYACPSLDPSSCGNFCMLDTGNDGCGPNENACYCQERYLDTYQISFRDEARSIRETLCLPATTEADCTLAHQDCFWLQDVGDTTGVCDSVHFRWDFCCEGEGCCDGNVPGASGTCQKKDKATSTNKKDDKEKKKKEKGDLVQQYNVKQIRANSNLSCTGVLRESLTFNPIFSFDTVLANVDQFGKECGLEKENVHPCNEYYGRKFDCRYNNCQWVTGYCYGPRSINTMTSSCVARPNGESGQFDRCCFEDETMDDMCYWMEGSFDLTSYLESRSKPYGAEDADSNNQDCYITLYEDGAVVDHAEMTVTFEKPNVSTACETLDGNRRNLAGDGANRNVLVLRVTTRSNTPTYTADELRDLIVGRSGGPSVFHQFELCSNGNRCLEPLRNSNGHPIDFGVFDVRINCETVGNSRDQAWGCSNKAKRAARARLGRLGNRWRRTNNINHLLFCFPAGGDWGARAAAELGGHESIYNGSCDNIGVVMHELGHNMFMSHSNENGVEYDDDTCLMGSVLLADAQDPRMCFNAAKLWQKNWYSPHAVTTDGMPTWSGKVVGIVHAGAPSADAVLVRAHGSMYVLFNNADIFNGRVTECPDKVTVVEWNGYSGLLRWRAPRASHLRACLGAGEEFAVDPSRPNAELIQVPSMDLPATLERGAEVIVTINQPPIVQCRNLEHVAGTLSTEGGCSVCPAEDEFLSLVVEDSLLPLSVVNLNGPPEIFSCTSDGAPLLDIPFPFTLSVVDAYGLPSGDTCEAAITFVDETGPSIRNVPDDEILPHDPMCVAPEVPPAPTDVTAYDACDGMETAVTVTTESSTPVGSCPDYDVTRSWTSVDSRGNSNTQIQRVSIVDDSPPNIKCSETSIEDTPGTPLRIRPRGEDNCSSQLDIVITDITCVGSIGTASSCESYVESEAGRDTAVILVEFAEGEDAVFVRIVAEATDSCGNLGRGICFIEILKSKSRRLGQE